MVFPDGPKLITLVLKSGECFQVVLREGGMSMREERVHLADFADEEGDLRQGTWVAARSQKRQGKGVSPGVPAGVLPCPHLPFRPGGHTLDFWPTEL